MMMAIMTVALAANKPYIARVLDYCPAPGQFVNVIPAMAEGEPKDSVLARAERLICGYEKIEEGLLPGGDVYRDTTTVIADGMITLGACGGYVVFAFDHPVVNVEGEYDFQVLGNSFLADSITTTAGSSEPGIVMVSVDANGNGLADDAWYELAGSEYDNPKTQHDYVITYYKPDPNKTPDAVPPFLLDATYVRWTSNDVDSLQEGYIEKNAFHKQSYWPMWLDDQETITFEMCKLPCNGFKTVNATTGASMDVQRPYDWGYVDNRKDYKYDTPLTDDIARTCNLGFKIDWAVDSDGNPVKLSHIDFVMVYNATNQKGGSIGEISTEVAGGFDIHPDAPLPEEPKYALGDVNADGSVNAGDISTTYSVMLGEVDDADIIARADVNADGSVNAGDISNIYSIMLAE